jgi:hypothetical protein
MPDDDDESPDAAGNARPVSRKVADEIEIV